MIHEGLTDAFHDIHMGITAENIVERYRITREDQDAFAAESQAAGEGAIREGRFKAEIVPVPVPQKKGEPKLSTPTSTRGRAPRARRWPAEARLQEGRDGDRGQRQRDQRRRGGGGRHHGRRARALGARPWPRRVLRLGRGRPEGHGHRPGARGAQGPGEGGMSPDRIDLFELNEAFAAQSLAVLRELKLDPPGQRERRRHRAGPSHRRLGRARAGHAAPRAPGPDKRLGLASLCIGGGQGVAMVVERL
jgi:acetyl-CoA C-acetyltransferase